MTTRLLLITIIIQINFTSCVQNDGVRTILGEEFAKVELERSLADTTVHNVVSNKIELIKDKETAIAIAERILFTIYGNDNIEKQRPYEIYKIKNYWSISGTLPRETLGGTFLIIMDARNGKVIRITHGK